MTRSILAALALAALATSGVAQTTFVPNLFAPNGIAQIEGGRILIIENSPGRVISVNAQGEEQATFAMTDLGTPSDVLQLEDGRILVVIIADVPESEGSRLISFDVEGGSRTTLASGLSNASSAVQLKDGRILVTEATGRPDNGRRVTAFNADGSGETPFAVGLSGPSGITQLQDGRVLVADGDQILAFNADGTGRTVFASGLDGPAGITQLDNGLILVAEINGNRLATFRPDGTGRASRATGLDRPVDLEELSDGRILVSEFNNDGRVVVFDGLPASPTTDLVVDTAADDQGFDLASSRAACTDGLADGDCTLREAILLANAFRGEPDLDTIGFDVLDAFGAQNGVVTISPGSPLPALEDDGITIDGYTQPGASPNTLAVGTDAVLLIEIDGTSTVEASGFAVSGPNATLRGLVINRFDASGVAAFGGGSNLAIEGSYIGTSVAGTAALPNRRFGVVAFSAAGLRVGTNGDGSDDLAERNVISGNVRTGVRFQGLSPDGVVAGNYIGTNAAGDDAISNTTNGVNADGAQGLRVGTNGDGISDEAERNVISGNGENGVLALNAANGTAAGLIVAGNYIGTNAAGTNELSNGAAGVNVAGAPNARVGTDGDGQGDDDERNVVSGNKTFGIAVSDGAIGSVVAGNYVGINAAGTAGIGNASHGIGIFRTSDIRVGTNGDGQSDAAERNVTSGNGTGIAVFNSPASSVVVAGNYVGTDAAGTGAIGNGIGVFVIQSGGARIGTDGNGSNDAAERNVISGNASDGVRFQEATTSVVAGNYIGPDATGAADLGNGGKGVFVFNTSSDIRIGSDGSSATGEGNVISGNRQGVKVENETSQRVSILGNAIRDNRGLGIDLEGGTETDGVTANDVGDTDSGPNGLQNYPVITSATGASVSFSLNSTANATYRVEVFASDDADPTGFGEGARYLGAESVQTDANGNATGSLSISGLEAGDVVTATATRTFEGSPGGTSEFSRAVTVLPTVQFATPATASAEEGDTVDLEVTLSTASTETVTVEIELVEDENPLTTTADLDGFGAQTETVTFAPGVTTQTVQITITEDGAAEGDETFRLDLENATGATIAQPARFVLQVDASEQTVTVTFAQTDITAREGQATTLAATLTTGDGAPLGENASFTFALVDGSADNDDFAAVAPSGPGDPGFDGDFPETLTAPAGTPTGTVFQIPVPIEDDGVDEPTEIANIQVTSPDATVVNGDLELTILDAPAVRFAAAAYVGEEGDTVTLRVTLDQPALGGETVDVVFTDGDPDSADSDDLDGFTSEMITFATGDTEATVRIDLEADGLTEGDEAFTFELQNLSGLGLGTPSETVLTVALSVATVSLETSFYEAVEGDSVEVEVTISDAAQGGETVTIVLDDTSGPSATSDDLGGFESVTVTFEDGETVATFTVPVTRDGIAEDTETFTLAIEDVDGLEVGDEDETVISVAPSRTGVQFADAAFMVAEGSTATLTLVLGEPAQGGETVEVVLVSTSPDGADADDVGGFTRQTVTFAAGDTTATVEVPVLEDGRTEDAESFTFEIQNATGLEVGTPSQTIVTVDPSATTISFGGQGEDGTITVGEGVGTVVLEVEFGEPLAENGTFDVVLASSSDDADGSTAAASNGAGPEDFDGFESVTVEVEAGATSVEVEIPITDDAVPEGTERFEFEIQNATGGGPNGLALGDASVTLIVTDNDNPVANNDSEIEESTVGFAYPNPTTGAAWIEVAVDAPQRVRVTVLDAVGRVVGVHALEVAGTEIIEVGGGLAPGVYLIRVSGTTVSATQQITVAR